MSDKWEDLLKTSRNNEHDPSSMGNIDTDSEISPAESELGMGFLYDDEDSIDDQPSLENANKEKIAMQDFFKEKWHFISMDGNPYSEPSKKADQIRSFLPSNERKNRPSVDEKIYDNLFFQSDLKWSWQIIRALGTSRDKQPKSEDKLPKELLAIASQLAASHCAFALRCNGDVRGGANFQIGQLENVAGRNHLEELLYSTFGIVDFEQSENEDKVDRSINYQQAKCIPIRMDTETLDRMLLQLEPDNWADYAASVVCGTECALNLEFLPIDDQMVKSLKEKLFMARKAEDELLHYLKDTQQFSGNYGISGGTSKSFVPKYRVFGKTQKFVKGEESRTYSGNYGYSSSQGISQNIETRDCEAEQMQRRLQNRIRMLEQMLLSKNGWAVRIIVSGSLINSNVMESLQCIIGGALQKIGYTCEWENLQNFGVKPCSSILLPDYLSQPLISFPQRNFIGFEVKPRPNLNLNPEKPKLTDFERTNGLALDDISLPIGTLMWNSKESKQIVRIPKKEINRHMFVCGKTGSGKSNTVTSFLTQLQSSLHYLVIEPVKGEYHSLPGIYRYNMIAGDQEHCLQMNPFWFPAGSSLQYHVDSLKLIISAAFDLYAAMPNILEQCLYRVYIKCGWDFVSGKNMYAGKLPEEYLFPTFHSLCEEVEQYLNESAFGDETRGDYEGALLSRLRSFTSGIKGLLLSTNKHIPVQEWAEKNVVVELDALADDADKAIVMGALLIQYFQYVKYVKHKNDTEGVRTLEHLFVLEEAHHLFKEKAPKTSSAGKGSGGSSSSQLVEMLDNLLAEARCYGEGFIIVDQSPSNVSTAVLKNTGVKVVHRSDYGDDVSMLQKALLLDENDRTTAYLGIGHALVRYGTMSSPCEVKIKLCEEKEKSKMHPATSQLSALENAYDRVFSNSQIMDEIHLLIPSFAIQLLAEEDVSVVQRMYEYFRITVADLISFKCGIDSVELLSDDDYYTPILELCITEYAQRLFPGQFCLSNMIALFTTRVAKILSYYRKTEAVEQTEEAWFENTMKKMSENQNLQKDWEILKNYRSNQIHPRMAMFYRNDRDRVTGICGTLYQDNYEKFCAVVPDIPIIEGLLLDEGDEPTYYERTMTEDGKIVLSVEAESQFNEKVQKLIFEPLTSRTQLWKDIIVSYENITSSRKAVKV